MLFSFTFLTFVLNLVFHELSPVSVRVVVLDIKTFTYIGQLLCVVNIRHETKNVLVFAINVKLHYTHNLFILS